MRILSINSLYPLSKNEKFVGGAEYTVKTIYEEFARRGHIVEVVRGAAPAEVASAEDINRVRVHSLPISRSYWPHDGLDRSDLRKLWWHVQEDFGRAPRQFADFVASYRPDVAVIHNISGIGTGALRILGKFRVPMLQVFHDYYYICSRTNMFRNGEPCNGLCFDCRATTYNRRRASALLSAVTAVSTHALKKILSRDVFVNARLKRVINNPINPSQVRRKPRPGEVVFGYIGRMKPEKGIYFLAQAFAQLPSHTRLIFAGDCPPAVRAKIEHLAGRTVEFTGFVEPDAFFEGIDVLVVPSLWDEPFGRVVVEGQARQVPAICADRGGLREAMGDQNTGWLFDPSRLENLVETMRSVLATPQEIEEKGRAGFARAAQFSPKLIVDRYEELITEVLGR